MSRVVKGLIGLFLVQWLLVPLMVVGILLGFIGASYQAGGGWIGWHVMGYLLLVAFAFIAFVQLAARYQGRGDLKLASWVALLAGALFGVDPQRFPGIHLQWWYLAVAVGSVVYGLFDPNWHEDHDRYSEPGEGWYDPMHQRVSTMLSHFAIPTVSLTCFLAYGWTWSMLGWVLLVDICLAAAAVAVHVFGGERAVGVAVTAA